MSFVAVASPGLAGAQVAAEKPLQLEIVDGLLAAENRVIRAHKDDLLRWRVTSNTQGELHLHGYRLAFPLQAGQQREIVFTAFATGRFRLEWHAPLDARVPAGHHAPPLAVLEVRPP